jgi:hypothetical protein
LSRTSLRGLPAIDKNVGSYKKADLQTLLEQLQAFVLFVKEKMKAAA